MDQDIRGKVWIKTLGEEGKCSTHPLCKDVYPLHVSLAVVCTPTTVDPVDSMNR